MAQIMLTTIDNPFNPFTEYDEWYSYDLELARKNNRTDCCSYLAAVTKTSDQLSFVDEVLAIEEAINEIVEYNVLGIFKKVTIDD